MNRLIKICVNNFSFNKLIVYMIRWQLSTPILGVATYLSTGASPWNSMTAAIWGNVIGSLIFFWIDLITFSMGNLEKQWEIKDNGKCIDCGNVGRVYRLALAPRYNRIKAVAEFRCEKCSIGKTKLLKEKGVDV